MRYIRTIAAALALVGGLLIVLSAFLITIDVLTRLFVGRIYLNSFEFSRLMFAVGVALSLAYAAVERAHIRIDLAISGRPAAMRVAFGVIAYFALGVVGAYLAVRGADLFMHSWRINATPVANVPIRLWVPQGVWLAGLAFFSATSFFMAVLAVRHALASRWQQAEALVGTPSVDDEIDASAPDEKQQPEQQS